MDFDEALDKILEAVICWNFVGLRVPICFCLHGVGG